MASYVKLCAATQGSEQVMICELHETHQKISDFSPGRVFSETRPLPRFLFAGRRACLWTCSVQLRRALHVTVALADLCNSRCLCPSSALWYPRYPGSLDCRPDVSASSVSRARAVLVVSLWDLYDIWSCASASRSSDTLGYSTRQLCIPHNCAKTLIVGLDNLSTHRRASCWSPSFFVEWRDVRYTSTRSSSRFRVPQVWLGSVHAICRKRYKAHGSKEMTSYAGQHVKISLAWS